MKIKNFIIVMSLGLGLLSCNQQEELYRVNRIINSYNTILLPQGQIDTIKQLFDLNRLSYANLQFYRFEKDALGYKSVRCNQFANCLKVFSSDLIYVFNPNNTFHYLMGVGVDKIKLDTKQAMNYEQVIAKFTACMKNDSDLGTAGTPSAKRYFELEFGYYDLNIGTGNAPHYTKTWKIKPLNSDYPFAYINDQDATVITYDNGYRFFD